VAWCLSEHSYFLFLHIFLTELVDLFQSIFPTFDNFEHKGVKAWSWRIFWTFFTFFPMYTIVIFFLHLDIHKLLGVNGAIYWWYIPVIPLMIGLGVVFAKKFGKKPSTKLVNKGHGKIITDTHVLPKNVKKIEIDK